MAAPLAGVAEVVEGVAEGAKSEPSARQPGLDSRLQPIGHRLAHRNLRDRPLGAAARALGTTQRILGYKVSKYNVEPKKYAG